MSNEVEHVVIGDITFTIEYDKNRNQVRIGNITFTETYDEERKFLEVFMDADGVSAPRMNVDRGDVGKVAKELAIEIMKGKLKPRPFDRG